MKKVFVGLLASASLIATPIVFAAKIGYFSTLHPQGSATTASTKKAWPTDITIVNASASSIYTIVPGTVIDDLVYPGTNDHIREPNYFGNTRVILQDPYSDTFFDQLVCHQALVTVYGMPGSYRVGVDTTLC